ncbi:MAG: GatB/YqeY domain-containing protein [Bacteroidetes bacterium]|nr:GatB/YqeY domain-containing protein [Bacteroidota bacterium]MCL6101695.1 GatB/YqeY domain-containing protein [Bacteroidota bacterium]
MALFDQINEDIRAAMLARDKERLEAVRNIKKVLLEAKTAKSGAEDLPDEEAIKAIAKLAKQGRDSAEIYEQQKRPDLAAFEMAQVKIYDSYLPKQLSDEELTAAIRSIIAACGATSMKEMGKVMGIAVKELAGKVDGKLISDKVRSLLA